VLPAFRAGHMGAGIVEGLEVMAEAVGAPGMVTAHLPIVSPTAPLGSLDNLMADVARTTGAATVLARGYRTGDDRLIDPDELLAPAHAAAVRRVLGAVAESAKGGEKPYVGIVAAEADPPGAKDAGASLRRVRTTAEDLTARGIDSVGIAVGLPAGVVAVRAASAARGKKAAALEAALAKALRGRGTDGGGAVVDALPAIWSAFVGAEAKMPGVALEGTEVPAAPPAGLADEARALTPAERTEVEGFLARAPKEMGATVGVLVVSSVGLGAEVGDYAQKVASAWGVDAALVVAAGENRVAFAIAPGAKARFREDTGAALLDVVFCRHVDDGIGEATRLFARHLVEGITAPGDTSARYVVPVLATAGGGGGGARTAAAVAPARARPSGASLTLRWMLGWVHLGLWLLLFVGLMVAVPASGHVPSVFHVVAFAAAAVVGVVLLVVIAAAGASLIVAVVGFLASGWILAAGWRRRCAACGKWCQEWSTTLSAATTLSAGSRQLFRKCTGCGEQSSEIRTIPRLTVTTSRSWSSSSGSSWSSGSSYSSGSSSSSSSFGGGSSGGGGASRGW